MAGQLIGQATPRNNGTYVGRLTNSYDPAGRRYLVLAEDGSRTTYGFDLSGQLIREQRSTGMMPVMLYDLAGRNYLRLPAAATFITYSFDVAGRPVGPAQQRQLCQPLDLQL